MHQSLCDALSFTLLCIQDPRPHLRECESPHRPPPPQQPAHHLGRVRPQTGHPRQEDQEMTSYNQHSVTINMCLNSLHTPRCSLKDIKVAFIVEQKLKPPIGLYYFEDLSCNVTHYSHVGPLLENVRLSARE